MVNFNIFLSKLSNNSVNQPIYIAEYSGSCYSHTGKYYKSLLANSIGIFQSFNNKNPIPEPKFDKISEVLNLTLKLDATFYKDEYSTNDIENISNTIFQWKELLVQPFKDEKKKKNISISCFQILITVCELD